jgi:hypothetical protein
MIHTDDSCIPTASAPHISEASDDLLHKLQKKSGTRAVPNNPLDMLESSSAPRLKLLQLSAT